MNRRALLRTAGLGLVAVPGCLTGGRANPGETTAPRDETTTTDELTTDERSVTTTRPIVTTETEKATRTTRTTVATATPTGTPVEYQVVNDGLVGGWFDEQSVGGEDYSIALVTSANGADIFDTDQLGQRARTLIEETAFDDEALVGFSLRGPNGGSDYYVDEVTTTDDATLAVWLHYEGRAGPQIEVRRNLLVRVTPDADQAESAVGVLSNPPYEDSDPHRFTAKDRETTRTE